MLAGFTPPYTPSGKSSLVPPPPWHYAGQIMSFRFKVEREPAQSLIPEGMGKATGLAAAHFCEWQATAEGWELVEPAYAQYKEFFVLIEVARQGGQVSYCPFIYVDQDLSMARGWMQGWPKKIGSVWMTRSYPFDHPAAAPMRAESRFGASLAVKDRRLAEARITLTGGDAQPIGFLAMPTLGVVATPSLVDTAPLEKTIVRAVVPATLQGPAYAATGELRFFKSPRDELSMLQPETMMAASVSTFALTVSGAVAE